MSDNVGFSDSKLKKLIIRKDDDLIEAIGCLDELSSFLGLIKTKNLNSTVVSDIVVLQNTIQYIQDTINGNKIKDRFHQNRLDNMVILKEKYYRSCDRHNNLPGTSEEHALFRICRDICRRAERRIVSLYFIKKLGNETMLHVIDMMSDVLLYLSENHTYCHYDLNIFD